MRKLLYSLYSNITDDEYFELKDKLDQIENEVSNILRDSNWYLNKSGKGSDYLVVDYLKDTIDFFGNLGLIFNGETEGKLFSFYVTKTFDVENIRYFMKENLFENKNLDFFSTDIDSYVKKAIIMYEGWTREHIQEFGEKTYMRI
jgi:hypothetical protein